MSEDKIEHAYCVYYDDFTSKRIQILKQDFTFMVIIYSI